MRKGVIYIKKGFKEPQPRNTYAQRVENAIKDGPYTERGRKYRFNKLVLLFLLRRFMLLLWSIYLLGVLWSIS